MKNLVVLITVYNDDAGLERVLKSITEPNYAFTVVIVDDGSERKVALDKASYPFPIEIIELPENRGTALASNAGLDWIRSRNFEFMARLDAGDRQRANRLSIQYDYMIRNPNLVLLGSNAVFRCETTDEELFETDLPCSWEKIKKWSVFHNCFIHPTVMIRLGKLDESFQYSTKYSYIDDYVFLTDIAERYPSEVLPDPLLECYVRKSGLSVKHNREQLLSGIKHHLNHPRIFNILWFAYIAKRLAYLVLPYRLKIASKKLFLKTKGANAGLRSCRSTTSEEDDIRAC